MRYKLAFCLSLLLFFSSFVGYAQQLENENGDLFPLSGGSFPDLGISAEYRGAVEVIPAGDAIEGDYISEMRFTPNGEEVWVLHRTTNNITVFDWDSQEIIENIEVGLMPVDIEFTDSYAVVACYSGEEVYLINLSDYSLAATFPTAPQPGKVRVSRDGTLAVIGCDEPDLAEVIDLVDLEKKAPITNFPVYLYRFSFITSNPRNSVYWSGFEISPDNAYLINGADENELRFYSLSTGEIEASIPEAGNSGMVTLSGDGNTLIASRPGSNGVLSRIDVINQSLMAQVTITDQSVSTAYSRIAVNWEGDRALVPVLPGNTALIDFEEETFSLVATGNTPDWVGQSADYQYAVAGDFYTAVIDFETGVIESSLSGRSIQNGAVSPANNRIMASDPLRYEAVFFYEFEDPEDLNFLGTSATGSELEADVPYSATFSHDGSRLLVPNSISGTLTVIDLGLEEVEAIIPLGSSESYQVSLTSDDRYALVAKRLENLVAVIDMETLEIVAEVSSGGSKPDQVFVLPGDEYAYVLNAGAPDRIGVIALDGANSSLETNFNCGNMGISWTNYGLRSDLKFNPAGTYAILAAPFSESVQIIDLSTHEIIKDLSIPGFPLQMAVSEDGDLGVFVAVTLKNSNELGIVSGIGPTAAVLGTYSCGENPTRVAYDPVSDNFALVSNNDKKVEIFKPEELDFIDATSYPDLTPISVAYSDNGHQFVLLRSDNENAPFDQLLVDEEAYDLPALPIQNIAVNSEGTRAAVLLPGVDEVVLFKEDALGWSQKRISLESPAFSLFPNPVQSEINIHPQRNDLSDCRIIIRTLSGQLVFEKSIRGNAPNLISRLADWRDGMYSYEIREGDQLIQAGKLVFR
jgi:DNA-binding beta-propeller fold protein YncE